MPPPKFDLTKLPSTAATKLRALRRAADDARTLARAAYDQTFALRDELSAAEAALAKLKAPAARVYRHISGDHVGPPESHALPQGLPDTDPMVIAARKEIVRLTGELESAERLNEMRGEQSGAAISLTARR